MKGTFILFSIIVVSILLTGCNIKIGDGTLTVSEDGVQYVTGDQSSIKNNNDITNINNEDTIDGKTTKNSTGNNDSSNTDMDQSHESTEENPSSNFNSLSDSEM